MEWKVHGHRQLYASDWVNLEIADVELPDGQRLAHHVLRLPRETVVVAMVDDAKRALMLWRHRFITNRWGWELPAGWVEPGEDLLTAASREALSSSSEVLHVTRSRDQPGPTGLRTELLVTCLEETGWQPGPLRPLCSFSADHGISDSQFRLYCADKATYVGPPADWTEASRVEWIPLASVRGLIDRHQIDDGATLTALLFLLAFGIDGHLRRSGDHQR
jgi:8-oxo-dGTP pyrophosphatase MutT (NUDIX family)